MSRDSRPGVNSSASASQGSSEKRWPRSSALLRTSLTVSSSCGDEHVEVVRLARLAPARLGAGESLGHARDQRLRRRDRMVVQAAHLAQVRGLPAGERLGIRIRAIEQARNARRDEERVGLDLERRELVAAKVGTRPRHGDGGIPAQEREHATEGVEPPEFLLELLIRSRRRQSAAPWWLDGRPQRGSRGPSRHSQVYQPGLWRGLVEQKFRFIIRYL